MRQDGCPAVVCALVFSVTNMMSPALGTSQGVGTGVLAIAYHRVFKDKNFSNAVLRGSSVALLGFGELLMD